MEVKLCLDSHLHFLDLPHIWAVSNEVFERAGLKALRLVRQVQPQPLRLGVADPDDDHVGSAGSAGVTLRSSADGDVVRDNLTERYIY